MIDYSRRRTLLVRHESHSLGTLFQKLLTMTRSRKVAWFDDVGLLRTHLIKRLVLWKPASFVSHYILSYVTCLSKMAENTETVVKMARCLAVAHIIVGFLIACFGFSKTNVNQWEIFSAWISAAICFCVWVSYEYSF